MLNRAQRGSSLVETLCALAVMSLLLLAGLRFLPLLHRQSHGGMQQTRLARQLDHSLLVIEKDLRRAGHCKTPCARPAVILGQRRGERENSCLIVSYAFYPTDARAPGGRLANETFGYRLRRGALETQRGALHCNEPGWANMHDPRQLTIKQVRFEPVALNAWRVTLLGCLSDRPDIGYRASRILVGRNG
ncbi:prepilin peptidase-dependent protein [Acerihabitans arboris]|uniref:Prepilin peptidase-dependent protein n=1 Tax=Acerihabitans arboris TaxID=2691583 RepID=A0A845SJV4_9GAMM|nr:prepilin peptidase-dependent protein [Acerihabitans arboris]NDL65523.1 prepilin peptidase-dependent protein [Acerihabitans arboris]